MSTKDAASPCVLLVDNGTLEPMAILRLREVAVALGQRLSCRVEPVSLQHSDQVPLELLGGRAAEVLESALRRRLAEGIADFFILPLFIGPTRALSEYLPQVVSRVRGEYPQIAVRVAPPLHDESEDQLARIIADQVEAMMAQVGWDARTRVALVDHGSPVRAVADVRDRIAVRSARLLRERVAAVAACSMERRPGAEYEFNEPLLTNLLATPPWNAGQVMVAPLFLLPGRHAGEGGDIARICARAESRQQGLRIVRTGLLTDGLELIPLLVERHRVLQAGVAIRRQ